jgi:hypothetical protein
MKATLEELRQMFKLKDSSFRQLKLGLNNKIKLVDAAHVEVSDTALQELLTKFRKSGAMTRKEVCSTYKITGAALMELVRSSSISYYQLHASKGSQMLFLKSDIEKEKEVFLTPVARVQKKKMETFVQSLISTLEKEKHLTEREREIFVSYYRNGRTETEIGARFGLDSDRVLQILNTIQARILRQFEQFINTYHTAYYTAFELNKMKEENSTLKKMADTIIDYARLHSYDAERMKFLGSSIRDSDLEVRAKNCLLAADVETVMDLLKHSRNDLLKFRNMGQKSLKEIEQFLLKNNIVW